MKKLTKKQQAEVANKKWEEQVKIILRKTDHSLLKVLTSKNK